MCVCVRVHSKLPDCLSHTHAHAHVPPSQAAEQQEQEQQQQQRQFLRISSMARSSFQAYTPRQGPLSTRDTKRSTPRVRLNTVTSTTYSRRTTPPRDTSRTASTAPALSARGEGGAGVLEESGVATSVAVAADTSAQVPAQEAAQQQEQHEGVEMPAEGAEAQQAQALAESGLGHGQQQEQAPVESEHTQQQVHEQQEGAELPAGSELAQQAEFEALVELGDALPSVPEGDEADEPTAEVVVEAVPDAGEVMQGGGQAEQVKAPAVSAAAPKRIASRKRAVRDARERAAQMATTAAAEVQGLSMSGGGFAEAGYTGFFEYGTARFRRERRKMGTVLGVVPSPVELAEMLRADLPMEAVRLVTLVCQVCSLMVRCVMNCDALCLQV